MLDARLPDPIYTCGMTDRAFRVGGRWPPEQVSSRRRRDAICLPASGAPAERAAAALPHGNGGLRCAASFRAYPHGAGATAAPLLRRPGPGLPPPLTQPAPRLDGPPPPSRDAPRLLPRS